MDIDTRLENSADFSVVTNSLQSRIARNCALFNQQFPIGAGDALAAGVIHGWLEGDFTRGLQMGTALAAMALGQVGDMVVVTPSALDDLLQKGQRGVRR